MNVFFVFWIFDEFPMNVCLFLNFFVFWLIFFDFLLIFLWISLIFLIWIDFEWVLGVWKWWKNGFFGVVVKMLENVEKVGFWDLGGYPCFSMILGFWGFLWISLNLWVFEWMNLWLNEWFDFDFHLFVLFFDWRIFFSLIVWDVVGRCCCWRWSCIWIWWICCIYI